MNAPIEPVFTSQRDTQGAAPLSPGKNLYPALGTPDAPKISHLPLGTPGV